MMSEQHYALPRWTENVTVWLSPMNPEFMFPDYGVLVHVETALGGKLLGETYHVTRFARLELIGQVIESALRETAIEVGRKLVFA